MKKHLCIIGNFYAPCSSDGFIDYIDKLYKKGCSIDVYIDETVIGRSPTLTEKDALSNIFYDSKVEYLKYSSFIKIFLFLLKEKRKVKRQYYNFIVDGSYSVYQKALLSVYSANDKDLYTFCCTTPYILYEVE